MSEKRPLAVKLWLGRWLLTPAIWAGLAAPAAPLIEDGRIPLYTIQGEIATMNTDFMSADEIREDYAVCDEIQRQAMRLKDATRLAHFPFDPARTVFSQPDWQKLNVKKVLGDQYLSKYVSLEKATVETDEGKNIYRLAILVNEVYDTPNRLADLMYMERKKREYLGIIKSFEMKTRQQNFNIKNINFAYYFDEIDNHNPIKYYDYMSDFFIHNGEIYNIRFGYGDIDRVYTNHSYNTGRICMFSFSSPDGWIEKNKCVERDNSGDIPYRHITCLSGTDEPLFEDGKNEKISR